MITLNNLFAFFVSHLASHTFGSNPTKLPDKKQAPRTGDYQNDFLRRVWESNEFSKALDPKNTARGRRRN
jgi:hypothetical protein